MQSAIGMIGALSALEHLYQGPGGPQHTWGCGMLALPGQASTASATFPMVPEEKHIKGTYLVLMVEGWPSLESVWEFKCVTEARLWQGIVCEAQVCLAPIKNSKQVQAPNINEIRILFSFLNVKIYSHISTIFCLGFLSTQRKIKIYWLFKKKEGKRSSSFLREEFLSLHKSIRTNKGVRSATDDFCSEKSPQWCQALL